MAKHFLAIAVLCTAIVLSCSGKVTYDLSDAGVIATSGDLRITTRAFVNFLEAARRARLPEAKDARGAVFMLVADHYLAAEYLKSKSGKADAAIEAEIEKASDETLAFYIRDKNPEKLFKTFVKKVSLPDTAKQKALFDDKAEAAYTNVPLKRAEAETVVLAQYGNIGEKQLTYAGLFDSLPQQGKLHLFTAPHAKSLEDMVMAYLRRAFLKDFVEAAPAAEKADYLDLMKIVRNSILSRNLRYEMGMENANPHADNSAVKERAKSVSFGRVKEFYEANKDKYKEVQTVDCRHIKLTNYDLAQNLRDKIDAGADMAALVKKHSLADDKNAAEPGFIKGIKNDTELHKRPRLETLCMLPKQGESEVVRDGDHYEVVKAEKRTDGYPPLDETTHLKDDIAREIAALDLKKEFDARKKKILKRVDISINANELGKIQ